MATDCVRYKDKLNDMQSIQKINDEIENELLEKRQSIEDVDGNRYEAFGKTPSDCRLPLQILTNETPSFLDNAVAEEPTPTPEEEDDVFTEKSDLSKGIFIGKGFGGELGVNAATTEVTIKLDPKHITIDNTVTEELDKLVWPCKEKREPCNVDEFTQTKGYEASFVTGKKNEYDTFKTAANITSDENCVILAFWQNRVFPICLATPKDKEDFNATVLKNYENQMKKHIFTTLEVNKKPYDG